MGSAATDAVGDTLDIAAGAVGDALGHVQSLGSEAAALIVGVEDGLPHPAGFVVFGTLAAANSALQTVHHAVPFTMEMSPAPCPTDSKYIHVHTEDLVILALIS